MDSYAYNVIIVREAPYGIVSAGSKFTAPASTVVLSETSAVKATLAEFGLTGSGTAFSESYNGSAPYGYVTSAFTAGGAAVVGELTDGWGGWTGYCTNTNCPPRHSQGSNWLLADGHAKWLISDQVSPGWLAAKPTTAFGTLIAAGNYSAAGTAALTPNFTATFSPI